MSTPDGADSLPPLQYFRCTRPCPEEPGVLLVEIDRAKKLNAFIEPMWLELGKLFTHLSSNPSVLAIVLSSSDPKAFTAGIDTATFASDPVFQLQGSRDPARQSHAIRASITTFQDCLTAVAKCRKPIIAAIHGHCLGLGVDLSLCADVRYAAADAAFAVKEVDIGLAADVGTLSRMPKVVGNGSWVWDVCLSGRGFGAQEAKEMGLVSRVCEGGAKEVLAEALKWATLVASKSPVAVAGTKEILQWSWDRSVEDGLRYTTVWNSAMLQSSDVKEIAVARVQKRRPRFAKL